MSLPLRARQIVLTAGITVITVTGAWYGASLKTAQESKEKENFVSALTPPSTRQAVPNLA